MNTHASRHFIWNINPKMLWAALSFFMISGTYHTYVAMTDDGRSLTNTPPPYLNVANSTLAKHQREVAQTTPQPAQHTEAPAVLPPYYTFPANSLELGRKINSAWFGEAHWPALRNLWTRESNWNPNAVNRSSGACGIPQALPCNKIQDTTPKGQIEWGLSYIERRYQNPTNAWRHFQSKGWY